MFPRCSSQLAAVMDFQLQTIFVAAQLLHMAYN
jgi:hypothetical protein